MLLGIQSLVRGLLFCWYWPSHLPLDLRAIMQLDEPNPMSVANHGPWEVYTRSVAEYKSRVRDFVASYKAKYADAS